MQRAIAQQAVGCLERRGTRVAPGHERVLSISVSLRWCNSASTARSNARSRNACAPGSELGRHVCNQWLARMVVNLFWLHHLEDSAVRTLSSTRPWSE
ncbi:hypothetical protein BER93_15430 [Xanthomonas fragariae]|nr:hypothetical protein BER92_15390 [Xanthomonas fragariae]AOD19247.1 hypothetical protein BER93_15430 [Xanthomonas fragariae]